MPRPRLIIVNLARDAIARPTPPPSPGTREVFLSFDLVAHELSLQAGGTVDVSIVATAHLPLPSTQGPPATALGTVSVFVQHPVDAGGCVWTRVFDDPTFAVTVTQPASPDLSLLIDIRGPEWHYDVLCPGPARVRVPAFGSESLGGLLGSMFPGRAGPGGVLVRTPAVTTTPDCIRRGAIERATGLLAEGSVTVWVYEPPCLLPVPGP